MNIDYEQLLNSVKEVLLEEQWDNYDLPGIVRNAVLCWDDTAVLVKGSDFELVFSLVSYDCLSVNSFDFKGVDLN